MSIHGDHEQIYRCGSLHDHDTASDARLCDQDYEARQIGNPSSLEFQTLEFRTYANDRERCLATAMKYVTRDRTAAHGNPESNCENIAAYWNAHLQARYGAQGPSVQLDAVDVAAMMAGMKLARLSFNPAHEDSWIDLAGYAACGMEIALKRVDSPEVLP